MGELAGIGPVGQACNTCWKFKKSCSNGGESGTIPKSPSTSTTHKCKVYLTTASTSIGHIVTADFDFTSGPSIPKCQKMGPSHN